jgi:putative adenylate-forming enzyme
MQIDAIATVVHAYLTARWRAARLRNRAAINRHHDRQLQLLTHSAVQNLPFYRAFARLPFEAWPVVDKSVLLDNFAAMNRAALDADSVRTSLAEGHDQLSGHMIGMSTGTSGNRGFYVITERERFIWLGTILAKTLPDALWRNHRVALALPALSGLYQSAQLGSRIDLRFFDLAAGPESWVNALTEFAPDTIVAPPKVLRWLAERGRLGAERIFSGAEVLDPLDRSVIETASGHPVREIYMATEGLFGVSCQHGTLHLAEDVVHFEFSRPDPSSALVSPIVTDFTRRAQAMIRYRMNDLIELDPQPCCCGSVYQAVKRIEGRQDDIFLLADNAGNQRMVTPDVLRNAVVDSDPSIKDFRIVQTGPSEIVVTLADEVPASINAFVESALSARFALLDVLPTIRFERGIAVNFGHKLCRVRREWSGVA